MFIRTWINIICLLAAAYGAHNVIVGKFYAQGTWPYYFCLVSPWVLLFGSMKAWHRCFTWRRMSAAKNITPDLSRGEHRPSRLKERPGMLEHACSALFLIAVWAILKQFGSDNATWWIGSSAGIYFMLHLLARKTR